MNKLETEFKDKCIAIILDMISRDTGKDPGDFGGIEGLIDWLIANGFKEHATVLESAL